MTGAAIKRAGPADRAMLLHSDVFDTPAQPAWLDECLADPRHHIFIAGIDGICVGFLSAVHYLHPDKAPQMWINELGVNDGHRRQGLATGLIEAAKYYARSLNCTALWVLADPTEDAIGFYESLNATRDGSHIAMYTIDLT